MLSIIALLLAALWLFGLVTTYTILGLVQVVLVVALSVSLLKLVRLHRNLRISRSA
jgi:hypothetical protein